MVVPFDLVRDSLHDLWKLDKAQCNQMLQSYNGTAASAEPMTTRALAFTVVLMMLLAFTILCSGLVRMFVGRQTLNFEPMLRILLRITFVLFLPALSSVFSLTKAQGGTGFLLTLLWLLLVELIRMKVQVMMLPVDGSSFSRSAGRFTVMDHADEVGFMVWAGYLVFFNMGGHDRDKAEKVWAATMRAMFSILWVLSFLKLMQRILNTWAASYSWHTARNPLLIAAYMKHVEEVDSKDNDTAPVPSTSPDAIMETCKFVVEGEHQLVFKQKRTRGVAEAHPKVVTTVGYGYGVGKSPSDQNDLKNVSLQLQPDLGNDHKKLVTIGNIWKWGKQKDDLGHLFCDRKGVLDWKGVYIQDLCFSFSLFKLLRRRFEQYPMVEVGSKMAGRVMLQGLLNLQGPGGAESSDRPFRVLHLELDFLERYYQAADRAAMSSLKSFTSNIIFSLLFVQIYLIAILAILVTTKDADYFYCMALVSSGRLENFPFLSFFITLALLATLICFESYEFFTTYLNFNWNVVRLVCYYGTLQPNNWKRQTVLRYMFRIRFWVFSMTTYLFRRLTYDDIRIKQVSIVNAYRLREETLATKAKKDIIEAMKLIDIETLTISLPRHVGAGPDDDSTRRIMAERSSTEIILASHLATELFEMEHLKNKKKKMMKGQNSRSARVVANTLSRYCMYLVAKKPELLPDDEVWVSERYKGMSASLSNVVQKCSRECMLSCMPAQCCKGTILDSLKRNPDHLDQTTRDAVELFDGIDRIEGWSNLASFWAQLVIYLAPSNDVQGHAKAVVTTGGDLMTCLWAFCTHAGITRQQPHELQELHGNVV